MNFRKLFLWMLAILTITLLILFSGCTSQPQIPPEAEELQKQVEEGEATREAVEAEFKEMNVSQLVESMQDDSMRGVEPFNSLAYREMITRGPEIGEELLTFIRKIPDRRSFLSLLVLRAVNLDLYRSLDSELGLAILIDSLQSSETFNAWGLPHLYWEAAAEAIIGYGEDAIPPLMKLLDDDRRAPVWGSEETHESERYQYRVKDYAWAMLLEIQGERMEIPVDPAARDKLISTQFDQ